MRWRGMAAVGIAGLVLLLASWVSASRPTPLVRTTGGGPPATGFRIPPPPPPPSGPAPRAPSTPDPEPVDDQLAQILFYVLTGILGLVAVAVVVLLAVVVYRRRTRRTERPEPTAAFDTVPEVLARDLPEQRRALATGPPSNAIIACWVRFEESIEQAGVVPDRSRTAAETVVVVLQRYAVDDAAVLELAELYREARFSAHPLREPERERAVAALERVHAGLRPIASPPRETVR